VDQGLLNFSLENIVLPQPVFFASLNYESHKDKKPLELALNNLCLEDTSLVITFIFNGRNIKRIKILGRLFSRVWGNFT
jgi:hypothetical protein